MTNEERDLITRFIERAAGAQSASLAAGAGQSPTPPLPPVDREADALIADLFQRHPEARYRITQMAFVQEHALVQAANRVQRLEWELQQARQQAQPQPQQPAASPWGQVPQQPESRGFLSGIFGGGRGPGPQRPPQGQYMPPQGPYAPPPQPQYPPGYNPGMFQQRGGSGFLGSALTTAAGVAGGLVAGHALMNMFSGDHGGLGSAASSAASDASGAAAAAASPWTDPGSAAASDSYAAGGAEKDVADNSGWSSGNQGGWDQPAPDQGGWNQASADDGGWSDGGGGGDENWS
jgi:hypothetical protein